VGAEVWSVTSWGELRRDGVDAEHHNLVHPDAEPRVPYVHEALAGDAPVVAVSDWMRAVPDQIRQWVPAPFTTLGTDGFGLSDTRPAARRHFAIDAESITVAALETLAAQGELDHGVAVEAAAKYRIDDPQAAGPQTSDPGVA
jgi:pyruvate dehydrogenase E1 component